MKSLATKLILAPLRMLNAFVRTVAADTHWLQYKAEGVLQGSAEWFDHELDVYWQWPRRQRGVFVERGVLNSITMGPTDRVLELCAGDGFFTQRFYAPNAREVIAIDSNAAAIAHAKRYHSAPNIEYVTGDVLRGLPPGPFNRVVWDAAMHHFDSEQIDSILEGVAVVLAPSGMISGYTMVEDGANYAYLVTMLAGRADVADRLARHFVHVAVLETEGAGRRNLYFFASDDQTVLPLSPLHPLVETRSRPPMRP